MKLTTLGLYTGHPGSRLQKIVTWLPKSFFHCCFLMLIISLLEVRTTFAQEDDRQYTVTYVVSKQTMYQITDPLKEFSPVEKVQLRPVMVQDSVIKEVDRNNNIVTSLFHIENTALEDWMNWPAKTIIDGSVTVSYDRLGNVLSKNMHSDKFQKATNSLIEFLTTSKSDIIPDYLPLSGDLKQAFADSGFILTVTQSGDYVFTRDSIELLFNDAKMMNEYKVFDTKGFLKYSKKSGYKLNEKLFAVPSYVIETRTDERFPANCVRQVTYTDYLSYHIEYFQSLRTENVQPGDILIIPNPAETDIVVSLPSAMQNVELILSDNTGRLIMEHRYNDMIKDIPLRIETLEKGLYIVSVHSGPISLTHTFIKN